MSALGGVRWSSLLVVAAVATSAGAEGARAQGRDPRLRWHTLTTEHFVVHYHTPLLPLAQRSAALCEEVHRLLVPLLQHLPSRRTHVILSDLTESANGSAEVLPFNLIRLFATAPEDLSPLGDYDDWLRLLIIHEYTHILHLDNIGGLAKAINAIFGRVWAPNVVQPRWLVEGYAVWQESMRTTGGRLRSTQFDMYLRMDALQNRLLRLDQISNSIDRWPRGTSWYLYGGRFVQHIAERYGESFFPLVAREYGRRAIPYQTNRAVRHVTGERYSHLYKNFLKSVRREAERVQQRIELQGRREGKRLTFHGETTLAPRFLDEKRLVYFAEDQRRLPELRELAVDPSRPDYGAKPAASKRLVRAAGRGVAAPHPDGGIVYSALADSQDIYLLNDLFRLGEGGGSQRLTRGFRAREPDVSPDGSTVAYVVNQAGTTHLALAQLHDVEGTHRTVLRNQRYGQIYTPRFSPDGRRLAYSVADPGGYRDIEILDLRSGHRRRIAPSRALDTGPAWSPDSRWLIFSSDRTGIANLYAYELDGGALWQATNVVGGAYQPAVSSDGKTIAYVGYTSIGFDLYALELRPQTWTPAPAVDDLRPPPIATEAKAPIASHRRYRPWATLLPRSYFIELGENSFGRQLTFTVDAGDLVNFHSYAARIGIGLERGEPQASLNWRINHLLVPLRLRGLRALTRRSGLVIAGQPRFWSEETYGLSAGPTYTWLRPFHSTTVTLDYSADFTRPEGAFEQVIDPNVPPPVLPQTGWNSLLRLSGVWSDARRQVYDISPSFGRTLSLSLSYAEPKLAAADRFASISWSAAQYVRVPYRSPRLQHHVWALRYGGGQSFDAHSGRPIFSLGGFPHQSLADQLVDDTFLGGVALRGYLPASQVGTAFHLLQNEYRFPVYRPQAGFRLVPAYLNRLYAGFFVDVGEAYIGRFRFEDLRVGIGGELLLDFTLGYNQTYTLRGGYAYGFGDLGGSHLYFHFGRPF